MHASADDQFVAHPVISSGNLKYVPYDRTYKGMPVYGGDFVVATDAVGHVLATTTAQDQTINLPSVTPAVSAERARAIARDEAAKSGTVASVTTPTLITYALGSPRLAWTADTTGQDSDGPSKLSVYVDALTGRVLSTQQHVLHGDGQGAWNGPNPLHIDTTHSGSTYKMTDPTRTTPPRPARTRPTTPRSAARTTAGVTATPPAKRPAAWTPLS
ncbi:PepSY domain-containing protein [Fodinicola feengrottensis]|uniref:PepSY domain-containing protein n=1 Tax=Fodinicola feengrottensis TaxID=435914 RepID=UPI0028BEB43B|nr:PepSY domain-containing protein [Fodinicola feengrottensis]